MITAPERPLASGSPRELAEAACAVVESPDASMRFVWPRAATHLGRQPLEGALRRFWAEVGQPAVWRTPRRAQLLWLPFFRKDPDLARRVAWTWAALSDAGHHRRFEAAPGAGDLRLWLTTVEDLITVVDGR